LFKLSQTLKVGVQRGYRLFCAAKGLEIVVRIHFLFHWYCTVGVANLSSTGIDWKIS